MYKNAIQLKKFNEINLNDDFFSSLKESYVGFNQWFQKKALLNEEAFVLEEDGIQGFLYLKEEYDEEQDITPSLPAIKKMKVGTFKVNPHGSKLGERFIKIIFDQMLSRNLKFVYLTIFSEHVGLIRLLEEYGFVYYGQKGGEQVYVKDFNQICGDPKKDYPLINTVGNKTFLLSIYPKFHTRLFPDSKLQTERNHYIKDLSVTNCIEKIYLSGSPAVLNYSYGDLVVMYRTADFGKAAEYSAVATSICTLICVENISKFNTVEAFLDFCKDRTIFTEAELRSFYREKRYPYIITFLYNLALPKRIIRKKLIEEVGIDRKERLVVYPLDKGQLGNILKIGEVSSNIIK